MADGFKGNRTSTPTEEDLFIAAVVTHTFVDVDSDGVLVQCQGEPSVRDGNCWCGALRRRELLRWGLESAGSAGRIKVYERFAEVADSFPTGMLTLTMSEARQMVAVAQHQIAQFTLAKPEWLRRKLESLGLAG